MTERWEERVRALQVDTPPDMWRRVQEGPRNEPPIGLPPPRQRTAAAVVALAVFVAAVVFAWQGLRPNATPGGSSSPTPPPGKAVYIDPLGWTAFYPSGWSVISLPKTSDGLGAGVVIENPGADLQGIVDDAVVLTVTHPLGATPDPSADSSAFPLSAKDFKVSPGSSNASLLQFRIDGVPYLATLRVDSSAKSADVKAMDEVIASIRPTSAMAGADVIWPAVIHSSHDPVSRPVSEACPVIRAELTVSPKTGVPGTTVTVSGPLYHLDEAGNFLWYADQQPGEDLQGWWNLDPEEYASVATEGLAIASGEPYEPSGMGPQMLGDDVPNGACGFSLSFVVPDMAAGSYPVTVVEVGGESSTAYGSFVFTVMQSAS